MTENGRSGREVRRRISLGKEAFNKKNDLMLEISQPSSAKTYGESICLECRVVWE